MASEILELRRLVDELGERVARLESRGSAVQAPPIRTSPAQREKLESWLAGYGFARLGIISLVTGVAFLVADSYAWLGAPLKILLGYTIAGSFLLTGRRMIAKREALGRILIAGGLGVAYYATYAMHYVPSARLITSPSLAFALLTAMVLVIISVAHRMQSETVAGVALFLGLHTGMVSAIGSFTLLSSVLLAAGAAFFLAKNRWVYVPISTLLAVYGTHLLWVLGNPMIAASSSHDPAHFATSIEFALLYFGTFSLALVLAAADLHKRATDAFALLNWGAFAAILAFEFDFHEQEGLAWAMSALAACMALLALLSARVRGRGAAYEAQIVLTLVTLILAVWLHASGLSLVIAWSVLCVASLVAASMLGMNRLAQLSSLILVLAYLALLPQIDNLGLGAALALATIVHDRLQGRWELRLALVPAGRLRLAHPAALACLATVALSSSMPAHFVALAWLGCALGLLLLGVALADFGYRISAMVVLVLSFARLFLIDMATMSSGYRISAFIGLGVSLLLISYGYSRHREA